MYLYFTILHVSESLKGLSVKLKSSRSAKPQHLTMFKIPDVRAEVLLQSMLRVCIDYWPSNTAGFKYRIDIWSGPSCRALDYLGWQWQTLLYCLSALEYAICKVSLVITGYSMSMIVQCPLFWVNSHILKLINSTRSHQICWKSVALTA